MKISEMKQLKTQKSVLALGMFDGVHIGHQLLLQRAKALARQQNVPLVACTFTEHPMKLISPDRCPPGLTTLEERADIMQAQGVDVLCLQSFGKEMMMESPETYIQELCARFQPLFIVVGYNFTFGRAGEGNAELLHALGHEFGFSTEIVPQIVYGGQEISSTVIRGMLDEGNVVDARELLGYAYGRTADVEKQTGGRLTLQFRDDEKQALPFGRYRVMLETENDGRVPALCEVTEGGQAALQIAGKKQLDSPVMVRFYQHDQAR